MEEIKKEIEEELEKKKAVEAKLQEETAKIAEEEPVKEFDFIVHEDILLI